MGSSDEIKTKPLTRLDFVKICGLMHDYNPIHLDSDFAHESGYEDVVCPGTLVLSIVGAVARHRSKGSVESISLNFLRPIFPHSKLVITCITDTNNFQVVVANAATNEVVARGYFK